MWREVDMKKKKACCCFVCPGPKLPKQPMTPTVSLRYVTAEASRILTRKSFIHQSQPFNCLKGVTYRPTICKAEQCDQIRGFFSAGRIWVGSGARSDMEQVRELLLTLLYSAAEVQMPPTTATESWTIYPTASFLTHWDWGVRGLAAGIPQHLVSDCKNGRSLPIPSTQQCHWSPSTSAWVSWTLEIQPLYAPPRMENIKAGLELLSLNKMLYMHTPSQILVL